MGRAKKAVDGHVNCFWMSKDVSSVGFGRCAIEKAELIALCNLVPITDN